MRKNANKITEFVCDKCHELQSANKKDTTEKNAENE